MNNFTGVGIAGKDLEILPVGEKFVGKGSIAIGHTYKSKDGEYGTEWMNFEFWGDKEYLDRKAKVVRKGNGISVQGSIESWESDGKRGFTIKNANVLPTKGISAKNAQEVKTSQPVEPKLSEDEVETLFEDIDAI